MSFVGELKRRNVVRVGLAYVVIAWVLAQIAEFAFDNFGAPEWVLKTVVVILLLGLPIALVIAWAFEVTPEGVMLEKHVDRSESITSQTGRKIDYLIIGVLIIAVGFLVFDKFGGGSSPAATTGTEQTIAVLPFVNMSDDSDHFADGLTEELLNLLAKNQDLKVVGRTSSFAFKGKNDDLRAIGAALGVAKVLEGSVRRSGIRLRVTAQLINVADGFHIWSETYDRELADVFDIQDEVAGAITAALKLHLTPAAKRITDSPAAYALYLEALALSSLDNETDIPDAIELLDRATAMDPKFAEAFYLKSLFHWSGSSIYVPAKVGQLRAYEAATKALEIDPTLAGAKAMAISADPHDWNWIKELEALKALTDVDRRVQALGTYAFDLLVAGYFREAESLYRQVVDIDPLSSSAWAQLADSLLAQGRDDAAKEAYRRSAALADGWDDASWKLFWLAVVVGDDQEAQRLLEPLFDAEYFRYPNPAAFIAAMRDADTGRAALQEWVEYRAANIKILYDRTIAYVYTLVFGHLDMFTAAIDSYGPPALEWSDAETLEIFGLGFHQSGYRRTRHYLERAQRTGLFELWDHRGAPDHCSKESGSWVCQ